MARLLQTETQTTGNDLYTTFANVNAGWTNDTGRELMIFAQVKLASLAGSSAEFLVGLTLGAAGFKF